MDELVTTALEDNKRKTTTRKSKKDKIDTDRFLEEIKGFESNRVEIALKSARIAWRVVIGCGVITAIAVGTVVVLVDTIITLQRPDPYLLISHQNNGTITVARPLADAKSISYGEVLDKHWLTTFAIARAGYEWETIQHSYNTMKLMAGRKVFDTYARYIQGDNSPAQTFAETKLIDVRVSGVTFLPETSSDQTLAQIHFSRTIRTKAGAIATGFAPTHWNATVTFDYLAEIKTEDERIINPLGFRVTSYREDQVLK